MEPHHDGSDLLHIAAFLAGNADQNQPNAPAQEPEGYRGRDHSRRMGGKTRGRKRQKDARQESMAIEMEERQQNNGAHPQFADNLNSSVHNQTGELRPGKSAWHCEVCDCWVPRKKPEDSDPWLTHIKGIQHMRKTLGLKLHGNSDETVVSQFEDLAAVRKVRRKEIDNIEEMLANEELENWHNHLLIKLCDYAGGAEYQRSKAALAFEAFKENWTSISNCSFPRRYHGQYTCNRYENDSLILACNPSRLAALTFALQKSRLSSLKSLRILVTLGPKADHPAFTAGLCALMESLPEISLEFLSIQIENADTANRIMSPVIQELNISCGHCLTLRHLDISLELSVNKSQQKPGFGIEWDQQITSAAKTLEQTKTLVKQIILLGSRNSESCGSTNFWELPNDIWKTIFDMSHMVFAPLTRGCEDRIPFSVTILRQNEVEDY